MNYFLNVPVTYLNDQERFEGCLSFMLDDEVGELLTRGKSRFYVENIGNSGVNTYVDVEFFDVDVTDPEFQMVNLVCERYDLDVDDQVIKAWAVENKWDFMQDNETDEPTAN